MTSTSTTIEPPSHLIVAVNALRSRWRDAFLFEPRWVGYLLLAGLTVGVLARSQLVWGFLAVAVVGVTIERRWPRHAEQRSLRPGLRTDVLHFLFTHFLQAAALLAAAAICYVLLHRFTIPATSAWLQSRPLLVQGAIGFLLFSFLMYWEHRLAHAAPFLWRFHAVHHSSEQLDWVAAARLHPLEFFFGGFLVAPPVILLGFRPVALGVFSGVTTAWALVEHANVRWRLRFLDRVYSTPEYHHWHHSLHAEARDKNFGLPLWDTLFGTYHMPPARRPEEYGITEPMPGSYTGQLAAPFRRPT